MAAILFIILWIICAIGLGVIYHTIFDVYYFGSKGCIKEILSTVVLGFIVAKLILEFLINHLWISAIIIVVIIILIVKIKGDHQ